MPASSTRRQTAHVLLELHEQRNLEGLRALATNLFARRLPEGSIAVLIDDGAARDWSVELSQGPGCPLQQGRRARREAWTATGLVRHTMSFRGMAIGELQLLPGPDRDEGDDWLPEFVEHYAAAVAKLKLDVAASTMIDHYCAGLQAFQEGVVLFQETDRDVTAARFLQLTTSLLRAKHAALLTYARVGEPASGLRLDQVLGVPDALVENMRAADGEWWPLRHLEGPPVLHGPDDPSFPHLEGPGAVAAVANVVTCPVRYHGVTAGLALVFNVEHADLDVDLKLSTLQGLCELGAALLHRFQLEGEAVFAKQLETQLAIAANIQARLLPAEPPRSPEWQCAWSSRPSRSIGGDYVDLLDGEDDGVLAIVADVSGHGIESALLAASARAHYRALAQRLPPGGALACLNRELHGEVGATGMFVTAAAVRLAADGRSLLVASAGHNPTLLYRAATGAVVRIDASGPPLGFLRDASFGESRHELEPGDVIVLYSDGITEAIGEGEEMFGEDRLEAVLVAFATQTPDAILRHILTAVDAFTGRSSLGDDASVVVFKARP